MLECNTTPLFNNSLYANCVSSQQHRSNKRTAADLCETPLVQKRSRHEINSFQTNPTWTCSECNKVFTSKSNLKVHLRVHTRVKPYHCKCCNYSCMHHSSIREHLAKIHPGVKHSAVTPAYVFNSVAVPDPDQFNSRSFDRDAFIKEARQTNDKLVAELNFNTRLGSSGSPASSLNYTSPDSNLLSLSSSSSSSSSSSPTFFHQEIIGSKANLSVPSTPKLVTNFSINSLIGPKETSDFKPELNFQSIVMFKYLQALSMFPSASYYQTSQVYNDYFNQLIAHQGYVNYNSLGAKNHTKPN